MPVARCPLLLSLVAVVALPLALAAADPPAVPAPPGNAALAGLWESEEVLGRGAALWLSSSGDAVWGTGMFVDGTYAVHGDRIALRLALRPDEDEKEGPQEQPLGNLTKSRWTREGDRHSEAWERVPASTSSGPRLGRVAKR